jgi:hypothetical protein
MKPNIYYTTILPVQIRHLVRPIALSGSHESGNIENKLFCRNHHLFTDSLLQKILPPKQILSKPIAIIQEIFERDLLVSISTGINFFFNGF